MRLTPGTSAHIFFQFTHWTIKLFVHFDYEKLTKNSFSPQLRASTITKRPSTSQSTQSKGKRLRVRRKVASGYVLTKSFPHLPADLASLWDMVAKVLCQWMWPGVTCLSLSDIGGWFPKRPWKEHLEGVEGSRVSDSRLRGKAPAAPEKWYCALSREGMHLFEFETLSFFVIVAAKVFLQDSISLFTKWGNLPWWPPGCYPDM